MLLATASCGSWNYHYNGELLGVILAWHIQLKEIPLILTTKWLIPTKLGSQGRIFSSLTLWKFNLFSLWCFSFKKQVIANCIVLLILSSALPALSRTLGKFELKFFIFVPSRTLGSHSQGQRPFWRFLWNSNFVCLPPKRTEIYTGWIGN